MARGNGEADAAADAGLLARLHVVDREAVFLDPLLVVVEIGVLEAP